MSGYITRAACRGRRPRQFSAYDGYQRVALVSRMLKERDVVRCIVAPPGFGKTSLAIEYAETVFEWQHVFWFSAKSPCFIRDLDAGMIAAFCFQTDSDIALAIFDDVPPLDSARMKAFSRELEVLLDKGCEVVLVGTPLTDFASGMQSDRICISAHDLLLSDEELDETLTQEERARRSTASVPAALRVPALVWGGKAEDQECFARNVLAGEFPSDLLLVMATILVVQSGSFNDIRAVGVINRQVFDDLAVEYPHVGIDEEAGTFEAAPLDAPSLANALRNRLDDLVARSSFDSREQLVVAWADMLVARGMASRACDMVRLICPRLHRGEWLTRRFRDLVRQACFYPGLQIARDWRIQESPIKEKMMAFEALSRMLLGDEERALGLAKRCALAPDARFDTRLCGALIAEKIGVGEMPEGIHEVIERKAQDEMGQDAFWPVLARAWLAVPRGHVVLAQVWEDAREVGASDDALCLIASQLFSMIGRETHSAPEELLEASVLKRPLERYVRARLSQDENRMIDYFSASAGFSLEECHNRGVPYADGALEAVVLFGLREVEMSMMAQRGKLEHDDREARRKQVERVQTRPDSFLGNRSTGNGRAPARSVPVLNIKLFGRFEVFCGDKPVDPKVMKRQNTRILLVLLAINQGREISRERLVKSMWPDSTPEVGLKNFYVAWSQLRKGLQLPDGTCPYLIRHQYGCSLERRYVNNDVDRFSEICRELLFAPADLDRWSLLFAEIDRDFSDELMPADNKNAIIVQSRNEYRSRLIDALVAATFSIIEAGHPQWGIWFARTAVNHDATREDAYVALMRAQIAGNQRTAAMMTYLKCRKVLGDQLGIDPSPETSSLYESLLDGDDD